MDQHQASGEQLAEAQPESVHPTPKTNWPLIAAGIGLPVLALVMALGLWRISQTSPDHLPQKPEVHEEVGTPAGVTMEKYTVLDAEERKALCNDGSPAVFYFSPGSSEHAEDWVIHLHGGGHCFDSESCAARAEREPDYTSSKGYDDTFKADGIFSRSKKNNPDFADWNHVEVMYCSSDLWSGTADGLVEGENWHFYGHYIVQAVIEDLKNPEVISTPTLADAEQVVFSGSSAGAAGAALNLDRVASLLPGVKVAGLLDSIFTFPVGAYNPTVAADSIISTQAIDYQGLLYDDSCLAATNDPDACSSLVGMYPYFETPAYVFTYQHDPIVMKNATGLNNLRDPDQRQFVETVYDPAYQEAIASIDPVFSPDEMKHTSATSDRFYTTKINGVSFAQAFGDWFFGRSDTTRYIE